MAEIRVVLTTAKHTLAAKQQEEQSLRALAIDAGCDIQALDEAIQKQHGGSPIGSASMELPTPPAAHRFAPTQTSVEASNQLALAHRQLTMSFKMAQVRAHRVLDTMDATITALREAVNAQRSMNNKSSSSEHADDNGWSVMIRHTDSFLTPTDREALQAVSDELCSCLRSLSSSSVDITPSSGPSVAMLWQAECLKDNRTRTFVADLAEAVRARLDASSGSDTEDSDANEAPVATSRPLWEQPVRTTDSSSSTAASVPTSMELEKAYELISTQCETGPGSEWDEQIRLDVTRTFGISARRQHRKSVDPTSRAVCTSNGVPISIDRRRSALQNVLRACANVDTEVGYCPGMDHVAALMLAVSDWNEARAFWLLVSLLASPQFELERLYGPGLPHLSLRCFQCISSRNLSTFGLSTFQSASWQRDYVLTQSSKFEISDRMLKHLEKEFEEETPATAKSKTRESGAARLANHHSSNRRPNKKESVVAPIIPATRTSTRPADSVTKERSHF
ncbi:unnamed protein product [Phytophthora lilii]|uniref:Unnamed protein product n=1 Tax=Phytophthora lilii TaxID=2077276 RepID=A0A9W6XA92_9STRA|nr:unnamed protein product [Phytophthora lilii]